VQFQTIIHLPSLLGIGIAWTDRLMQATAAMAAAQHASQLPRRCGGADGHLR